MGKRLPSPSIFLNSPQLFGTLTSVIGLWGCTEVLADMQQHVLHAPVSIGRGGFADNPVAVVDVTEDKFAVFVAAATSVTTLVAALIRLNSTPASGLP